MVYFKYIVHNLKKNFLFDKIETKPIFVLLYALRNFFNKSTIIQYKRIKFMFRPQKFRLLKLGCDHFSRKLIYWKIFNNGLKTTKIIIPTFVNYKRKLNSQVIKNCFKLTKKMKIKYHLNLGMVKNFKKLLIIYPNGKTIIKVMIKYQILQFLNNLI